MLQKNTDIPYQQLPFVGQFNIFPLLGFKTELTRQPHRHDHYQVVWFSKGSGQHIVDFVSYELEDNMLFLLEPGQVHQLLDDAKEGHVITFTEHFYFSNRHEQATMYDFTNLFDATRGYAPIRISNRTAATFQLLAELMYREKSASGSSRSIIKHYLNAFLLQAEREKKRNAAQAIAPLKGDERVVLLRRLLEKNFRAQHHVTFYASEFSLTPKRLNEITREKTGKTVTELLHDRLVLEAKRKLSFSHQSVKEISYELGFEDPAYFSRFFKNHAGIAPQDFRDVMFK
ncbi:transcriptional regulator, AraC family [Chitinophaga rupis]|uniref:Transcriptional regulator, AraC family n=1 Tax=Chitinophaga rupis TaxID=573321 RepID=A0A1H7KUI8_9BACT|nr:helix-turn-helix domain-containing protein [Chitinophaga rupis]SEK90533.1 transcriptional regulator, AraC family [Chitinophaga rupis]